MYFKSQNPQQNSSIRVPLGYKGNAFPSPKPAKPIEIAKKQIPEPIIALDEQKISEPLQTPCESCQAQQVLDVQESKKEEKLKPVEKGILGFDGGLDAEELLILALALIVFQGGKENELALLLLALLFIK